MKKISLLLVFCFMFLMFPVSSVAEGTFSAASDIGFVEAGTLDYIEDELIVWTNVYVEPAICKDGTSIDFFGVAVTEIDPLFTTSGNGVAIWSELSRNRFPYCLKLSDGWDAVGATNKLVQSKGIRTVSFNYVVENPIEKSTIGSGSRDTLNSGTGVDYTQWAHEYLEISSVWGMGFTGSANVKMAVLDTGFVQHVDLQNNLDMSVAYDVYDKDTDVTTTNNHGNRVAGIIGADYNDGGVNGLCRNVTLIPIKIGDNTSNAYSNYDVQEEGIIKAIELGADIINMSFGLSKVEDDLIDIIEDNDILFVTSAGNNGKNITSEVPSGTGGKRHDSPNWIVVGAMTQQEGKHSSSNYSSRYVDLFAPGENNMTTSINNDYTNISQTSGATPHVAAACALLMSKATHKTPLQIRQLILDNVKELNGFNTYCATGGTLSIVNAIEALYEENRGAYTKGDISGDGYVDVTDYTLCKRICLNTFSPTAVQRDAADVDEDGDVDVVDYTLINRYCQRTFYCPPF